MSECFCHFNGYEVKDAAARRDIAEHAKKLSEQSVKLDSQQDQILQNGDQICNMQSEAQLLQKLAAFSLKNVVCIGDSFLDGALYGSEQASYGRNLHGWGRYLKDMAQTDNPDAIFRYEFSEGYAGFAAIGQGEYGVDFKGQIELYNNSMNDTEKQAVETVIIVGGVNDCLQGKKAIIWETVNKAKSVFLNAKIVVAMSPLISMQDPFLFYQLRKPTHDPRVCVLTDSWRLLIADSETYGDSIHPNILGYKRIAAYLYHASKGLSYGSAILYEKVFEGIWGSVNVRFFKDEGTVTMSVVGYVNDGSMGFIEIGARPFWMRQTSHEVVIPIWSDVKGVALQFVNDKFKIIMPEHTGQATINGSVSAGFDIF